MMPFWWGRMWDSPRFQNKLYQRWWDVRHSVFDIDRLMNYIDDTAAMLEEAQQRNFQRWQILNQWIWPNVHVGGAYESEISYLKEWLQDRVEWMDDHVAFSATRVTAQDDAPIVKDFVLNKNYPNPFNSQTVIPIQLHKNASVLVELFDINGRRVKTLLNENRASGTYTLVWNGRDDYGQDAASGVYTVRFTANNSVETLKILLLR